MSVGGAGWMGVGGSGWQGQNSGPLGNSPRDQLAGALRIKFGLEREEPTSVQVEGIILDIGQVRRKRTPTHTDWKDAVERNCGTAGTQVYYAVDNSDLNGLLDIILGPHSKPTSKP